MPEAPMSQCVRAQVVFPHKSGLPRDSIVNTFHFWCSVLDSANLQKIMNMLHDFYTNAGDQSGVFIDQYLSNTIDKSAPVKIKAYDLGDPVLHNAEGNVTQTRPVHESSFLLLHPMVGSTILPSETAVTMSYWADRNAPRHRGRVFIGPLAGEAVQNVDSLEARPVAALRNVIRDRAKALALDASAEGVRWGLFSPTDQVVRYPILGGWVDDACDTVRKRGLRATTRSTFTV